jgi:very-short-patch-repair endonuclease
VLPDGRSVFLDAAYREARVVVELDGARFHHGRRARQRDMRRDSALAAVGWLVLRFSCERLTQDPAGCRADIEAVVRRRLGH